MVGSCCVAMSKLLLMAGINTNTHLHTQVHTHTHTHTRTHMSGCVAMSKLLLPLDSDDLGVIVFPRAGFEAGGTV